MNLKYLHMNDHVQSIRGYSMTKMLTIWMCIYEFMNLLIYVFNLIGVEIRKFNFFKSLQYSPMISISKKSFNFFLLFIRKIYCQLCTSYKLLFPNNDINFSCTKLYSLSGSLEYTSNLPSSQ